MNTTVGQVGRLTPEALNEKFRMQAEERIAYYSKHPEEIEQRLRELDKEWDIERAIETEAAGTILGGLLLGATLSRKWFVLPAFAAGMLLLHNLQGAYPLLPLFRRLGFRTAQEIAAERYALKTVRGDFQPAAGGGENQQDISQVFRSAEATSLTE
jgi:hypothetical protein